MDPKDKRIAELEANLDKALLIIKKHEGLSKAKDEHITNLTGAMWVFILLALSVTMLLIRLHIGD